MTNDGKLVVNAIKMKQIEANPKDRDKNIKFSLKFGLILVQKHAKVTPKDFALHK